MGKERVVFQSSSLRVFLEITFFYRKTPSRGGFLHALAKFNIDPEKLPIGQQESSLPTINFQGLC